MPRLVIDNRPVEVPIGATLLDAAHALGIEIPTLCHLEGFEHSTSCFVCVVKLKGKPGLVPSCATVAADGLEVESETDEVRDARTMALELLLSDHLGDCIGPCHAVCPAHMNIPLMIRQIAAGRLRDAVVTVKEHIPLPSVLGRICPAPCEKGCRRGQHDAPLSICLLKRIVGDADLAAPEPWLPERRPSTGRRVAVIGAGPAGLSAAWYLLRDGHGVTLFDDHAKPGGMLQYAVPEDKLPRAALDAEIALVARLGAELRLGQRVESIAELQGDFDAILVAAGELRPGDAARLGLPASKTGVEADRETLATPVAGVFAAGGAIRPQKMAVRSVADGRAAASSISAFLSGSSHASRITHHAFSTHIGKLKEGEMAAFLAEASDVPRVEPSGGLAAGLTEAEARAEALRCLHCDCRKPGACRLRRWSAALEASPSRFKGERRTFVQHRQHSQILYEPGKCIRCGLCIQVCAREKEELGLTFIGRGFDVVVGVPFDRPIAEGLRKTAAACVAACPTGALALRDGEDPSPSR
ncbi:MAG TPA: 2Fe-2S iron-sulfur cluster-binding protein [Planctomycetota bacterium]|nr:2Fe-2S iron-sulfur cluster-binding protein [Planctomycetota bacterium]HRR81616.1 2Fe-2S iron-sulfur cluster-binding protein [Planctomycetota bacterium]HRT93089.1 2Fe-2S iron-sulfur cluster-binding protein [Planctomycetota bacterium]